MNSFYSFVCLHNTRGFIFAVFVDWFFRFVSFLILGLLFFSSLLLMCKSDLPRTCYCNVCGPEYYIFIYFPLILEISLYDMELSACVFAHDASHSVNIFCNVFDFAHKLFDVSSELVKNILPTEFDFGVSLFFGYC